MLRIPDPMYAARPGRADLRTMGDATTRGSPIPLQPVSKHMPSAKKTPICAVHEDWSKCYDLAVKPGLPLSPPRRPGFSLALIHLSAWKGNSPKFALTAF